MKALVKVKPEPGLVYTEVEQPRIQSPDDVLFKVEYCAICVGETKVYDWNSWAANDATLVLPTVLGHEAAGVVVLEPLITHVLPMADFACGFEMVKQHNVQKILLQP